MPQQINLCSNVSRAPKQRFGAKTMLPALGVCVLAGVGLGAGWAWNLERSAQGYRQTLDTQAGEIQSLQAAIQRSRATAGPVDAMLLAQQQERRLAVVQREKVLDAVLLGMLRPGEGHSDRLLMVARSIPSPAWLTSVTLDVARFEVAGFTLEPAALNDWVARLAAAPLMRDLKLSTVTVESTSVSSKSAAGAKPSWAFTLVNLEPPPPAPANAQGVKP
jgi:Tfp pilus assembly protein PilN